MEHEKLNEYQELYESPTTLQVSNNLTEHEELNESRTI
jgi:hypothetical protein